MYRTVTSFTALSARSAVFVSHTELNQLTSPSPYAAASYDDSRLSINVQTTYPEASDLRQSGRVCIVLHVWPSKLMIKSIQISWLIGTYVQLRLSTALCVLSILTLRHCLSIHHATATPLCVKTVLRFLPDYRVCRMAYNTRPLAFKPVVRDILRTGAKPKEKTSASHITYTFILYWYTPLTGARGSAVG